MGLSPARDVASSHIGCSGVNTITKCGDPRARPSSSWLALTFVRLVGTTAHLLDGFAELVRLRQAMGEPAGIRAVTAPVGQLLHGHALVAAGRILPSKSHLGIEGRDIGERGAGV